MDKADGGKSRPPWRPWSTVVLSLHREPGTSDRFKRLRKLGHLYTSTLATARGLSAEIENEVEIARAAGDSLAEISAASGLSIPQIEYILVAVDVQRELAKYSISHWGSTAIAYPSPRPTEPGRHKRNNAVATRRWAQ